MNSKHIIFLLIVLTILIAGCGKKECEFAKNCLEKKCFTAMCLKGQCEYTARINCCGNDNCEASETRCNCSDCKPACLGGKGKYLVYMCSDEKQCILDSKRQNVSLVEDFPFQYFRFEATTTYEQPFDVNRSVFVLTLQLKSIVPGLVPPIRVTSMQLLEKKVLLARNATNLTFTNPGDTGTMRLRMVNMPLIESEKVVTLKMDYEYDRKSGSSILHDIKSYEKLYSSRLIILDPSRAT